MLKKKGREMMLDDFDRKSLRRILEPVFDNGFWRIGFNEKDMKI